MHTPPANTNNQPRRKQFQNNRPRNSKPIYDPKYIERRKKNLCFWCDEKFHPVHKCEKRRLHSIEICPLEEENEEFLEASDNDFAQGDDGKEEQQ